MYNVYYIYCSLGCWFNCCSKLHVMIEKQILYEIEQHRKSLDSNELTIKWWIKDINRYTQEIISKKIENRESKIRLIADVADKLVSAVIVSNNLNELIRVKTNLLMSLNDKDSK